MIAKESPEKGYDGAHGPAPGVKEWQVEYDIRGSNDVRIPLRYKREKRQWVACGVEGEEVELLQ